MGGAERVVDVHVPECGELPRELGIVGLLARFEADVLEHADVTVTQRIDHALGAVADHVGGEAHIRPEQAAQSGGDRSQPCAVVDPAPGAAEVSDHDHPGASSPECFDGWDRLADPAIVADLAIAHRHVEVLAQQDPLAVHIDVIDGRLGQRHHSGLEPGHDEVHEVHDAAGVSPLVVVPGEHLDGSVTEQHRRRRIEDR